MQWNQLVSALLVTMCVWFTNCVLLTVSATNSWSRVSKRWLLFFGLGLELGFDFSSRRNLVGRIRK